MCLCTLHLFYHIGSKMQQNIHRILKDKQKLWYQRYTYTITRRSQYSRSFTFWQNFKFSLKTRSEVFPDLIEEVQNFKIFLDSNLNFWRRILTRSTARGISLIQKNVRDFSEQRIRISDGFFLKRKDFCRRCFENAELKMTEWTPQKTNPLCYFVLLDKSTQWIKVFWNSAIFQGQKEKRDWSCD